MGTILVKEAIKREPGFLYYIDKDGNLCSSKMVHGGRKKGSGKVKKVKKVKKTTLKQLAAKKSKKVATKKSAVKKSIKKKK